jgi:hypothetical protein
MLRIAGMRCLVIALAALTAVVVAASASAGGVPVQITSVADRLWVASDRGVQVVDATTGAVHRGPGTTYPYATSVAWLGNTVWIASITNGYLAGVVDGFNSSTGAPLHRSLRSHHSAVYALASSGDMLWAWFGSPASARNSTLVRLARGASSKPHRIAVTARLGWMVATPQGLWFTNGKTVASIGRFDAAPITIANTPAPSAPLAYGAGGVWVISGRTATRFDSATRHRDASVHAPQQIILLAISRNALWLVTGNSHPKLLAMTLHGRITRSRPLAFVPTDLRYAYGRLWLGNSGTRPAIVEFDSRSLRKERSVSLS